MKEDQRAKIASRSAQKRLVDVEDMAAAVSDLISDAVRKVTGTVLTVDAGNIA